MKIKVSKKDLWALFYCFAFIPVDAIRLVIGSFGYFVLMLIGSAFALLQGVKDKTITKSRQFIIWFMLMIWMTICTIVNYQPIIWPIYYVGMVAIWFLINDWYLEKESLSLLRISRLYVGAVIVVTFIQQMVAPSIFGFTGGMNARNVFTSDNFLGYYYLAYIAVCVILDFVDYNKIQSKTYIMTGICMASIIKAWSVKSVIGLGIVILYILFLYKKKIARLLNTRNIVILFVIIFVAVVFYNVQDHFIDFFSKYFGKDATVSIRYYIWTQAIENIKAHPVFGYGIREGQRLLLQQTWAGNARSSHNIILELILEGGFIGFGLFLLSIVTALSNKKETVKGQNQYEYYFLLFVIFCFFVMELASGSIYYPYYYMPIILINNLDRLVEIKRMNDESGVKYG